MLRYRLWIHIMIYSSQMEINWIWEVYWLLHPQLALCSTWQIAQKNKREHRGSCQCECFPVSQAAQLLEISTKQTEGSASYTNMNMVKANHTCDTWQGMAWGFQLPSGCFSQLFCWNGLLYKLIHAQTDKDHKPERSQGKLFQLGVAAHTHTHAYTSQKPSPVLHRIFLFLCFGSRNI